METIIGFVRWLKIPRLLRALGLDTSRLAAWSLARVRGRIAALHLSGTGIEIGALHFPLPLPAGATALYLDQASREDNIRAHPELNARRIVRTDIVADGSRLACIAPGSLDFLVANHMLEHTVDPLGALERWTQTLRPGGHLFVAVPIASMCFDRGRPITALAHMIEDRELCLAGAIERMRRRNREHYLEWVSISLANVDPQRPPAADAAERADSLAAAAAEIHFHTFSPESFESLTRYFCAMRGPAMQLVEYRPSGGEIIAVLRYSRAP